MSKKKDIIFIDHELLEDSVIRKFRITAQDGKIQKFDVTFRFGRYSYTTFKTEEL